MAVSFYGKCKFITATNIEIHIFCYQICTLGNKSDYIIGVIFATLFYNPRKFRLILQKPLPKIVNTVLERHFLIAATNKIDCIFIIRRQFIGFCEIRQRFLYPVQIVEGIAHTKIPIGVLRTLVQG